MYLPKSEKERYKQYVQGGLDAAQDGLNQNSAHARCNLVGYHVANCCFKFYGIFLNYHSELGGLKKKIENSFKLKEYFMVNNIHTFNTTLKNQKKAHEGDPEDPVALHALGKW